MNYFKHNSTTCMFSNLSGKTGRQSKHKSYSLWPLLGHALKVLSLFTVYIFYNHSKKCYEPMKSCKTTGDSGNICKE